MDSQDEYIVDSKSWFTEGCYASPCVPDDHNYARTQIPDDFLNDMKFSSDAKELQEIHKLYVLHVEALTREAAFLRRVEKVNKALFDENRRLEVALQEMRSSFTSVTEKNIQLNEEVEELKKQVALEIGKPEVVTFTRTTQTTYGYGNYDEDTTPRGNVEHIICNPVLAERPVVVETVAPPSADYGETLNRPIDSNVISDSVSKKRPATVKTEPTSGDEAATTQNLDSYPSVRAINAAKKKKIAETAHLHDTCVKKIGQAGFGQESTDVSRINSKRIEESEPQSSPLVADQTAAASVDTNKIANVPQNSNEDPDQPRKSPSSTSQSVQPKISASKRAQPFKIVIRAGERRTDKGHESKICIERDHTSTKLGSLEIQSGSDLSHVETDECKEESVGDAIEEKSIDFHEPDVCDIKVEDEVMPVQPDVSIDLPVNTGEQTTISNPIQTATSNPSTTDITDQSKAEKLDMLVLDTLSEEARTLWKCFRDEMKIPCGQKPTKFDYELFFKRLRINRRVVFASLLSKYTTLDSIHQRLYGQSLDKWPCILMATLPNETIIESNTRSNTRNFFTLHDIVSFVADPELSTKYWTLRKVIAIFAFFGGHKASELRHICQENLRYCTNGIEVKYDRARDNKCQGSTYLIPRSTYVDRTEITVCFATCVHQYIESLDKDHKCSPGKPLFYVARDQSDTCNTDELLGIKELDEVSVEVAKILVKPQPHKYTGNCWRESGATAAADIDTSDINLQAMKNPSKTLIETSKIFANDLYEQQNVPLDWWDSA